MLNELFGAIVAGLALAFGLAFGLGGRDAAQRLLNQTESAVGTVASQGGVTSGLQQATSTSQGETYYAEQLNQPLQSTDQTRTFPSNEATRRKGAANRPLTDR